MAKNVDHRPVSVIELLRQLQGVEAELKLAVTPLELAHDAGTTRARSLPDDDDATRIKGVTEIQAQAPIVAISSIPANPVGIGPVADRRREGLLAEPEVANTVHRPAVDTFEPRSPEHRSRRTLLIAAGSVLVVAAAVTGFALSRGDSSPTTPRVQDTTEINDQIGTGPEPVASFTGTVNADATYTFTWVPPGAAGEQFAVSDVGANTPPKQVDGATYTGPTKCIEVETLAPNGVISAAVQGCAP
jgi:hypothetical protein